jgi:PAS domain S-box-containing protein
MPTSWKSNPSSKPDSEDDVSWTDSIIFGTGSLVGTSTIPFNADASGMDESRLRLAASVFANTHDGIMITDAKGCILDINRAYAKISGYSPEEIVGKMPDFLKSDAHPIEFYEQIWQRLKKNGSWRGEICNRRKNGNLCPELLSISAVLDAHGEVTHYVAIYTDITDLKK